VFDSLRRWTSWSVWCRRNWGTPQRLSVDLGSVRTLSGIVLRLPPGADWNSRIQTLTVYGSKGTSGQFTIVLPVGCTFDAATATLSASPSPPRPPATYSCTSPPPVAGPRSNCPNSPSTDLYRAPTVQQDARRQRK
jgi:hypothetical protein